MKWFQINLPLCAAADVDVGLGSKGDVAHHVNVGIHGRAQECQKRRYVGGEEALA